MGLFRRRGGTARSTARQAEAASVGHLEQFARTRRGVEAFVEPRTAVTDMTVALVAADGEWTRRRVAGPHVARALGESLGIPVYDVAATGYPPRMREWTRRRKLAGEPRASDASAAPGSE